MKPLTYRAHESVITKSVNPRLGHYAISKITPAMIQSYFAGVVRERHSNKTANNHLVLLKTIFKHAQQRNKGEQKTKGTVPFVPLFSEGRREVVPHPEDAKGFLLDDIAKRIK